MKIERNKDHPLKKEFKKRNNQQKIKEYMWIKYTHKKNKTKLRYLLHPPKI